MSSLRRPIMLVTMVAVVLLMVFSVVVSLAAPAASAREPRIRDLVIRSITIDPQTKVATARGAVTCRGGDGAIVFVDVSQTVGRLHTVAASGDKDVDCDGRVRFSLRLRNDEGRLGAGDARVESFALTCTPEECFGVDFNRMMRITTAH